MTDPLIATVSPVFSVDGTVNRALGRDCVHLEVEEGVEGLRTMRADFVAIGPGATGPPDQMLHMDGQAVDFGQQVKVSVGPESAERTVFEGIVSGLEVVFADSEPPRLVVYAEDVLMRLRMTRRMRTYANVTDAEIAQQVVGAHQLQCDAAVDGPRYDVVQQLNQSDLAFLRERARLVQAELWCTDRTVHFRSRTNRRGPRLTLVQGNELIATRITADLAHQRSEVVVTGFDAQAKSVVEQRAGNEAIQAEVSDGRTGPQVVQRALDGSTSFRVREVALTAEEASAWAKAEMLRRARAFVTVSGLTRGSPDMVVGTVLKLQSVGPPFEGDGYYVTKVCHTYEHAQGLRTRFEAERPTVNQAAS